MNLQKSVNKVNDAQTSDSLLEVTLNARHTFEVRVMLLALR
jgi:hypothetical protein